MHITQFNTSQTAQWKKKQQQNKKNIKVPKQTRIKIHQLHQYISSIFIGCSMPPLDQFLQLEIQDDQCIVKLQNYKRQNFENNQSKQDWIYYLESGKIWLRNIQNRKQDQNQQIRTTSRVISGNSMTSSKLAKKQSKKDKTIQIKQNNFFMLMNIKKYSQAQLLQISEYENGQFKKCLLGKIKINPKFNLSWYLQESSKHYFLSKIFQNQNFDISQHKLKGLSRFFKYESFRRGTLLCIEGQQNQRLCIVKSGECQFSKNFSYNQQNHSNIKMIKVAIGGPQAVIGSQFVLFDFMGISKMATVGVKAMSQIQNKVQKLSLKFYDKNINNFTVSVLSGYAEIYYISIAKFKQLCEKYVQQVPQQLRKSIQPNYITLLRTTKQKLQLQLTKIQRNESKVSEQRNLIEAKMSSGYFESQLNKNQYNSESPIKLKKSQFFSTNLQGQQIQKTRNKRLQKKIQLILQSKKTPVNYKKKIQIALKQKFTPKRFVQSPLIEQDNDSKNQETSPTMYQSADIIKKDLESIFMNNQQKYRSNTIQKQNQFLSQKQNLLKKRYESMNNMLVVHQQFYDKNKNKLFRMDLIRRGAISGKQQENTKPVKKNSGIPQKNFAQNYTSKVKKQCLQKINKANKIKQQFMTIRAQCQNCHCYDDIESYLNIKSQKDIKMQTMKTGSAWRSSQSKNTNYQQPLQKLHSRTKLLSEKAQRKYQHNIHLLEKKRRFVSGSQRRLSAPLI